MRRWLARPAAAGTTPWCSGEKERLPLRRGLAQYKVALRGPCWSALRAVFLNKKVESARLHGFRSVSLGPRILRVETAALVAVALTQSALGGLD